MKKNDMLSQVCSLLVGINKSCNSIRKNNAIVHEAIFEIKKKYPDLFDELIFDESGIIPFSDELEQILFGLESGEVLSTPNSEYRRYDIKNVDYLKEKAKNCDKNLTNAINMIIPSIC